MMQAAGFAEERRLSSTPSRTTHKQMDPTLNTYSRSSIVLQNPFQGLYKLARTASRFIPACAESYTVSEDGMTYTFTLKRRAEVVRRSDLTAKDFEYSWKRVLNPAVASGSRATCGC
jgi:oligopeptide transport system substrate-binding protein